MNVGVYVYRYEVRGDVDGICYCLRHKLHHWGSSS